MSFIEEVEQAEKRTQIKKAMPVVALAVAAVVLAAVFFLLQGVFNGSGFVLSNEGEATEAVAEEEADADGEAASTAAGIYIYVSGAVVTPGVYTLPESARITDAITAAGGFSKKADTEALNLAQALTDGERVDVPTKAETKAASSAAAASSSGTTSSSPTSSSSSSASTSAAGKVNINTAGLEELKTLSGIGDVTAQKIIDYREAEGPFQSIEDIKNVSGIADKKFEAIADYICVS